VLAATRLIFSELRLRKNLDNIKMVYIIYSFIDNVNRKHDNKLKWHVMYPNIALNGCFFKVLNGTGKFNKVIYNNFTLALLTRNGSMLV